MSLARPHQRETFRVTPGLRDPHRLLRENKRGPTAPRPPTPGPTGPDSTGPDSTGDDGEPAIRLVPNVDLEIEEREPREHPIVCAVCGFSITSEDQRISVQGAHEHRFSNPHGFVFDIGCFRDAPGCVLFGDPTLEFTWFPGFAWRFARCGGCGEHMGWQFSNTSGSSFLGLDLKLLASESPG